MRKTRESILRTLQQRLDPVAIRDTCTMNFRPEYQALRIYQKVTLSTLDLLTPVVAALFAAHISSFERLAVDYACAGLRIAPKANREVQALVTPTEKAIAGDYVTSMSASARGESANQSFRITVTTSTLWGIAGVGIIGIALLVLVGAVARFGRR